MSQDSSDRRAAPRQPLYLGVELANKRGLEKCGITKNASESGLLLLTLTALEVGEHVELRVLAAGTGQSLAPLTGRVTRHEELSEQEAQVWAFKLAVALDRPLSEVYEELQSVADKQAKAYGTL